MSASESPFDFSRARRIYANLSASALVEEAVRRGEGTLADTGALVVSTGKFTGRSPRDRYIVRDAQTEGQVDWGRVNQPFDPDAFQSLCERAQEYVQDKDMFVTDAYAGADPSHRLPIRVVTEQAWHALFARQLFVLPSYGEMQSPAFTIVDMGRFQPDLERDGTNSGTFIILDFTRRLVLISGTEYAGEIKKSVFSALNFLLPQEDVFPMHCAANVGVDGDVALFFGLSGTGKTTLSANPARRLVGDDEHGWSEAGVFNFEGGCYAKCIHLSQAREPEIWSAIRYGTVLENVALDPATRQADYDSSQFTENTRAAYPLDFISNAVIPSLAGHPRHIIFLTADAFGVLPPIARLTRDQAMYYFLSGYTSKLAGTEVGVTSPEATFSTCFGAPFMPLNPGRYARMLGERLQQHGAQCWLLNTGWTGGPYGIGKRIDLALTRKMVEAILSGMLDEIAYSQDAVFGMHLPQTCPGVPPALLDPAATWPRPEEHFAAARQLAALFVENFHRFENENADLKFAGPRVVA